MQGLVGLLVGLLLHKAAEAFAIGIVFVKMGLRRRQWLPQLTIFALVSPVGMVIALVITQLGIGAELLYSYAGSFTAGALMYVGILGVIVEEFTEETSVVVKFFLLLGGLLAMGAANSFTSIIMS